MLSTDVVNTYVPRTMITPCQIHAHRHLNKEVRFKQRIKWILNKTSMIYSS